MTLLDEGQLHFFANYEPWQYMINEYIVKNAPRDLRFDWKFYSSLQPVDDADVFLNNTEQFRDIGIENIKVKPSFNPESHRIDLYLSSRKFAGYRDAELESIMYYGLPHILGERVLEYHVGKLSFGEEDAEQSIPLMEIRDAIERMTRSNGYVFQPTLNLTFINEYDVPGGVDDRRTDVDKMYSEFPMYINLIGQFGRAEIDQRLKSFGVEYLILEYDVKNPEDVSLERAYLQKEIRDLLGRRDGHEIGNILFSSYGKKHIYFDVLVFDPLRFQSEYKNVLKTPVRIRPLSDPDSV